MSGSGAPNVIRLRSRVSTPLAMIGASLFLAFLVGTMVRLRVAWDPWWVAPITPVLAAFAAWYLRLGVLTLASRRERTVTIEESGFSFRGVNIPREQVAVVRQDYDRVFKGSRVELTDGTFLRLPAHIHRPGRILRAFRRARYPVQ